MSPTSPDPNDSTDESGGDPDDRSDDAGVDRQDAPEEPTDEQPEDTSADRTGSGTPESRQSGGSAAEWFDDGPDADGESGAGSFLGSGRQVVLGVVAIAFVGLVARVVALGARPAHFDEARVAYWALYTQETGHFAYRSIIHGPFIQHVDRFIFGWVGPSDFVMRLPVAIVGGLFPLSALLFRHRLRREETLALAFFLSFNPVLLYYSRFMRSDVLVAAFMFTALGFLVRLAETRDLRYLYGATFFAALGIASKENAILYLLTWGGAGALVLDRALDRPGSDTAGTQRLVDWGRSGTDWLRTHARPQHRRRLAVAGLHVLGAALLFGLVWLFMFAPRGNGLEGLKTFGEPAKASVGLWEAAGNPGKWPALVDATYSQFMDQYLAFGDKARDLTYEQYRDRLENSIRKGIGATSLPLALFAVAGFVRERYASAEGRVIVFFLAFAGAASVVGYPIGLSIGSGWKWNVIHVLVPLSLPAAVGAGTVVRWGLEAFEDDDPIDMGLTTFILLLAVALVAYNAVPMYTTAQSDENPIVQFAQPIDDLDPMADALEEASASQGTDLLVYSDRDVRVPLVHQEGVEERYNVKPTCTVLAHFLPAQWYIYAADAETTCVRESDVLKQRIQEQSIPVVITKVRDDTVPREWLRQRYARVGNFSLRYYERADPTLEVWARTNGTQAGS